MLALVFNRNARGERGTGQGVACGSDLVATIIRTAGGVRCAMSDLARCQDVAAESGRGCGALAVGRVWRSAAHAYGIALCDSACRKMLALVFNRNARGVRGTEHGVACGADLEATIIRTAGGVRCAMSDLARCQDVAAESGRGCGALRRVGCWRGLAWCSACLRHCG